MKEETRKILPALRRYRHGLEQRMSEHMDMDENVRNTSGFGILYECWDKTRKMEKHLMHCKLKPSDLTAWAEGMKNADGTQGAHWTKEQTTAAAKMAGVLMGHVSQEDFWVAMNMMYSDYSLMADKFNVNKPEFFAEMAKAFLFDKDGPDPDEKLAAYYWAIVCGND